MSCCKGGVCVLQAGLLDRFSKWSHFCIWEMMPLELGGVWWGAFFARKKAKVMALHGISGLSAHTSFDLLRCFQSDNCFVSSMRHTFSPFKDVAVLTSCHCGQELMELLGRRFAAYQVIPFMSLKSAGPLLRDQAEPKQVACPWWLEALVWRNSWNEKKRFVERILKKPQITARP